MRKKRQMRERKEAVEREREEVLANTANRRNRNKRKLLGTRCQFTNEGLRNTTENFYLHTLENCIIFLFIFC